MWVQSGEQVACLPGSKDRGKRFPVESSPPSLVPSHGRRLPDQHGLSPFGLLYQNTVDWVHYKQQTLFLTVLEAEKAEIKVQAVLVSGEEGLLPSL